MRLGWYSRLTIVLMVFWTVGKAEFEHNANYWTGIEAQAGQITSCFEGEMRKLPDAGRRQGETCNDYADMLAIAAGAGLLKLHRKPPPGEVSKRRHRARAECANQWR